MSERVLRAGVVGLGRIAWSCHLPNLQKHPGFELAAVADPLEAARAEAMAAFGVPQGYPGLAEMLAAEKLDLVVICSPTRFHEEHAVMALEAGCHVFCDKPAAMNHGAYRNMLDASRRSGRVLEIYQPRRINQDAADIRALMASGKLGPLYQVRVFAANYVRRNDWQAFRRNGGGMLFNYGSHYVDQCLSLLGREAKLLGCSARRILSLGDADDVVKVLLDIGGVEVDLDINQAAAVAPYLYLLYGEYGAALQRADEPGKWRLRYYDPAEAPEVHLQEGLKAEGRAYPRQAYPFREEVFTGAEAPNPGETYYKNLYAALTAGAPLLNPPEDTLALTALLDRAAAQAQA